MLTAAFIALAVLALSVATVFWLIREAPEGHEDREGFQFGSLDQPAAPPPAREEPKMAQPGSLKAPSV